MDDVGFAFLASAFFPALPLLIFLFRVLLCFCPLPSAEGDYAYLMCPDVGCRC